MSKTKRYFAVILTLAVVLCNVGCKEKKNENVIADSTVNIESEETRTIVDCIGREVIIPVKIDRVVDLQLDATKTLIQLGEKDKVVGLTKRGLMSFKASETGKSKFKWSLISKIAPELKDLTEIGALYSEPNMEAVLSLEPDIIFSPVLTEDKIEAIEKQSGIPVVCVDNAKTKLDYGMLKLIGEIMGKEERAQEIILYSKKIMKDIDDVTSQIKEDEKVKVFIITPPCFDLTANVLKTTSGYEPINMAGGINLSDSADVKMSSWEVSKEQISVWNPDVILNLTSYNVGENIIKANEGKINNLRMDPILKVTNAAKNNRIYTYMGYDYGWDTATAVLQVPYMAKLFYPDKFKDLDVEVLGNEIIRMYYGVDDVYTDMLEKHNLVNFKLGG